MITWHYTQVCFLPNEILFTHPIVLSSLHYRLTASAADYLRLLLTIAPLFSTLSYCCHDNTNYPSISTTFSFTLDTILTFLHTSERKESNQMHLPMATFMPAGMHLLQDRAQIPH